MPGRTDYTRDREVVAKAMAKAQGERSGYVGVDLEAFIERTWRTHMAVADLAVEVLDNERMLRALNEGGLFRTVKEEVASFAYETSLAKQMVVLPYGPPH